MPLLDHVTKHWNTIKVNKLMINCCQEWSKRKRKKVAGLKCVHNVGMLPVSSLPFPLHSLISFYYPVCWRKHVQRPAASTSISHMETRIQNQTSQAHPPICFEACLKGLHIGPLVDLNGCAPSVNNTADFCLPSTAYSVIVCCVVTSLVGL